MPGPVRFGIQTPQEGMPYDALAAHWRAADELGFHSVWLDDHFYPVVRPQTEPQMEAWTLLAALARETQRIRIGILVGCNYYRCPRGAEMAASTTCCPPAVSSTAWGGMVPTGIERRLRLPVRRVRLAQLENRSASRSPLTRSAPRSRAAHR